MVSSEKNRTSGEFSATRFSSLESVASEMCVRAWKLWAAPMQTYRTAPEYDQKLSM